MKLDLTWRKMIPLTLSRWLQWLAAVISIRDVGEPFLRLGWPVVVVGGRGFVSTCQPPYLLQLLMISLSSSSGFTPQPASHFTVFPPVD